MTSNLICFIFACLGIFGSEASIIFQDNTRAERLVLVLVLFYCSLWVGILIGKMIPKR